MTNTSIYKCSKGHDSTELDFCSECGVKILGVTEQALSTHTIDSQATVSTSTNVETCPACSTLHEPNSGDFCEICGYNFVTGVHGEVPITKEVAVVEEQGKPEKISHPQLPVVSWEIVVTIDSSLRHPESPKPPTNQPAIAFSLDKPINLIGRTSEVRAIHPEISLDFDNAVSHRHALLYRQADGTFTLRDIDSANGTKLNGVELQPMIDAPLQDQDVFTLGHWTRIVIKKLS